MSMPTPEELKQFILDQKMNCIKNLGHYRNLDDMNHQNLWLGGLQQCFRFLIFLGHDPNEMKSETFTGEIKLIEEAPHDNK